MVRPFPPAHRAGRAQESDAHRSGEPSVVDTVLQSLPPLTFMTAWVCAGTVVVALLMLLGRTMAR